MLTNNAKLGVIIPFFRGDQYILPCISSLLADKFAEGPLAIYVIDNNDEDSEQLKQAHEWDIVKIRKVRAAIGYGRACNLGAEWAAEEDCDYLIFLNQDTLLGEGTLYKLYRALNSHDFLHVFSPMIYEYDFEYLSMTLIGKYLAANPAYFTDSLHGRIKEKYQLPNIGAACIALHTRLISQIGLFDPVFPMYGEDYDFFKRLQRQQGKLYILPSATIAHRSSMNTLSGALSQFGSLRYMQAQVIKKIRYENSLTALRKALFYLRICLFKVGIRAAATYLILLGEIIGQYARIRDQRIDSIKKRMQSYCLKDNSVDISS